MNLKETYNKIAHDWVQDHEKDTWGKSGADQFLSFLPLGSSVLDVGCGGGSKTNYIVQKGYHTAGIDFSEAMIDIAKTSYPQLKFSVLDMYNIDEYPHMVDGIFVQAALLHIEKNRAREVIAKMIQKLNPGGLLYVAVKEKRDGGVDEEIKTENDYGYDYQRYFSYYTIDELREYFLDLNLEIIWEGDAETASHWLQIIGKRR